jgi:hypothetical protein
MQNIITKPLRDPTDWFHEFDEVLFVRIYVHLGEESPERAVSETIKSMTTPLARKPVDPALITELGLKCMSNPRVIDAINQHLHEKIYRAREMGTQWIIQATQDVYERCMQMVPVKDSAGAPVFAKFNPTAALKAVELAGKHVDVQAFKEVVEYDTGPNLTAVLDAARRRLEEGSNAITIDAEDDSATEYQEISADQVEENIHTLDEMLGTANDASA